MREQPQRDRNPVVRADRERERDRDRERPPERAERAQGVLEVAAQGHGFLRDPARAYAPAPGDAFVPRELVQRLRLRPGALLEGEAQRDRHGRLQLRVLASVEGMPHAEWLERPVFESLTSISPNKRFRFETVPERLTTRVIDLMTPLGRGQRALVVSPPRAGKTTILRDLGEGLTRNHPDMRLEVLLVDERPEEVTDFRRGLPGATVYASSNDRDSAEHVRLARLVVDRARRRVEVGESVFLLADSLTRIARAFNHHVGSSGRTLSGGLDSRAMEEPKRLFGAARETEEGGSLTIVATILVDTGSRMDQLIFEEFKGTGNTEIVLDRKLAERRIWPAVDLQKSGTRKEEQLLTPEELQKVTRLRRRLGEVKPEDATAMLVDKLQKTGSNAEFLARIA